MTTDRGFTHPNFGNEVRVELHGLEVRIVFIAKTSVQADSLCDSILSQLQARRAQHHADGKPTSVVEN